MRQILFLTFLVPLITFAQSKVTCVLKGELKNRPESSVIYLAPDGIDFRTTDFIKIPIVDGKFNYTLICDYEQVYGITFEEEYMDGNMRVTSFMVENGSVDFVFYPRNSDSENKVKSKGKFGKLYNKYNSVFYKTLEDLRRKQRSLPDGGISEEGRELLTQIEQKRKAGEVITLGQEIKLVREFPNFTTKENQTLSQKIEQENSVVKQKVLAFVQKDNSIVGLSLFEGLFQHNKYEGKDNSILIDAFNKNYRDKFADHPTGRKIVALIDSKPE